MEGIVVIVHSPGNESGGCMAHAYDRGEMVFLNHPPQQLSTFEAATLEEAVEKAAQIGRECLQCESVVRPKVLYDATLWLLRIELDDSAFGRLHEQVRWNFVSLAELRAIPGIGAALDHVLAAVEG